MKKQLPPSYHPLAFWLKRKKINALAFAAKSKIPFRTVYDQLAAVSQNPQLATMEAIETATDGAVTVGKQAAWFRAQRAK